MRYLKSLILATTFIFSFLLSGCQKATTNRYDFTISATTLTLEQEESKELTVTKITKNGSNIINYEINWYSADIKVATVTNKGIVTGVNKGSTLIKAKAHILDTDAYVEATCSVDVISKKDRLIIDPEAVTINLKVTKTASVSAYFNGELTNSVIWSISNRSIATVSSGVITAKSVGTAEITAKYSSDASLTASCYLSVINSTGTITSITVSPSTASIDASIGETVQLAADVTGTGDYIKDVTWKSSDTNLATVNTTSGLVTAVSSGTVNITATSVLDTKKSANCVVTVVDARDVEVSLNETSIQIAQTRSKQLNATVKYAVNKNVTWESNKAGVTVTNGLVNVSETVPVGSTAIITARSVEDPTKTATCSVTVLEKPDYSYDYTIMLYMSGSSLEYDGSRIDAYPGLFTEDIKEILSVNNLPSTVKIIIQTGGAAKWALTKGYIDGADSISSSKLQRWEVSNQKIKLISTLSNNDMATSLSYQSFLEWGLNDYSAEQMGVIISGHGAGIGGCAPDDNSGNVLNTPELISATRKALNNTGRDKMTWMGFDCCLMQSADVASVMSDYFDYMVASQETEAGEGWNHDVYLQELVKNPLCSPETLLPVIADSFVKDIHQKYCSSSSKCLQTLSVLDLKEMDDFVDAFNTYVNQCGTSSTAASKYLKAYTYSYNAFGEGYYGLTDFKSYINKLSAQFSSVSTTNLLEALDNLVIANSYCSRYSSAPCGVSAFFPYCSDTYYGLQVSRSDYTGSDATKFTPYQTMCYNYGSWVRY